MITAIDTNILLDILIPNERFYQTSADALEEAAGEGSLVISDIVYAELCIQFGEQRECDAFLESNEIRVQALTREAHFLARAVHGGPIGSREADQNPGGLSDWSTRPETGKSPAFETGGSTVSCLDRLNCMIRREADNTDAPPKK